jgi:hypothetical protein
MITAIKVDENPVPHLSQTVGMSETDAGTETKNEGNAPRQVPEASAPAALAPLTQATTLSTASPEKSQRAETPPKSPGLVLEAKVPEHASGFKEELAADEAIDRRLAEIEMIGEEVATGWKPHLHHTLSPEVRYLHVSRTIHQLVTDRNRSVGIFLAVASILVAAATGMLNVKSEVTPIIPLKEIQYWCLPVTFCTLAVLSVFISLLLIRARIGLIYEVTKMNTLLGVESKRVERVNPLSIFYIMHLLVVVLGGASAGFCAAMIGFDWLDDGVIGVNVDQAQRTGPPDLEHALSMVDMFNPRGPTVGAAGPVAIGLVVALVFILCLQTLYYSMVLRNTTDAKLATARP